MDMMVTRYQGRTRREERDWNLLKMMAVFDRFARGHGRQSQ